MIKPPEIKNPCPMAWSEMRGDSRTRFCDHCQLHVQNLSAMSKREIAQVLARSETEHVCVTYTRRGDGSIATRWDSIVDLILGPLRRGLAWLLAGCVPIVLSACQTTQTGAPVMGYVSPTCSPQKKTTQQEERVMVAGRI